MTNEELKEIIFRSQQDGATLYKVAETLHKIMMIFVWVIGIIGLIAALNLLGENVGATLGVLLLTVISCAILYAGSVMSTHGARVLVNISFANIAMLEKEKQ